MDWSAGTVTQEKVKKMTKNINKSEKPCYDGLANSPV